MEIQVINTTSDHYIDILVLDDVITHVEVNMVFYPSHKWLLDSNASFHVTPQKEQFMCRDAKKESNLEPHIIVI